MVQAHPVRSAKLHSAPSHNYFAIFLTARDRILERIVCSFYSPLNRTLLTVIAFYALFRAFGLPRGPHAAQVHYFDTSISKYLFCPRYFSRLSQLTLSDLPFQLFQSITEGFGYMVFGYKVFSGIWSIFGWSQSV